MREVGRDDTYVSGNDKNFSLKLTFQQMIHNNSYCNYNAFIAELGLTSIVIVKSSHKTQQNQFLL